MTVVRDDLYLDVAALMRNPLWEGADAGELAEALGQPLPMVRAALAAIRRDAFGLDVIARVQTTALLSGFQGDWRELLEDACNLWLDVQLAQRERVTREALANLERARRLLEDDARRRTA